MSRALSLLPLPLRKTITLYEHRCYNCNSKLCDAAVTEGIIEIKCKKCGQMNYIIGSADKRKIS